MLSSNLKVCVPVPVNTVQTNSPKKKKERDALSGGQERNIFSMLLWQFLKHFEKCASLLTRDFQTPALLLEWCAICFFKPKKCAMAQKRLGNTELLCAMSFGKDFLNILRWAECFPYYLAEQAVSIF